MNISLQRIIPLKKYFLQTIICHVEGKFQKIFKVFLKKTGVHKTLRGIHKLRFRFFFDHTTPLHPSWQLYYIKWAKSIQ